MALDGGMFDDSIAATPAAEPYAGAYKAEVDDKHPALTMTILGSREQYCVNPAVNRKANKNEVRCGAGCQLLLYVAPR